ncbi:MAG: insulinase family protein [Bacteroidales bacterium]|nr:insulinase family protein [Bacteroidales bacterium]
MKKFMIIVAAILMAAQGLWAQSQEEMMAQMMRPLPNDPAVRTGKLDNGLTYYIRHNALPAQRAEFYLATDVGAIQEEYPSQDGLAHFLEHMCFNGTKNFPDKGILDYLRSIGAEFGRNINASTGWEETQYMLNNIPVARESVVDSCLLILHDYSHFVTCDPVEIDKERGVIIEERRQRRNASWRFHEKKLPYYYGDTKWASCTLIGLQEHLETFKPESLVEFYQTWYHPGNQAVIVVGDIDVDRTEKKLAEIFSDIPAKENPKAKEPIMIPGHEEPLVGIFTDPEASVSSIEMIWEKDAMPEQYNATIIGKSKGLMEDVIAGVMSERFNDITSKSDSPFISADLGTGNLCETMEATMSDVTLRDDNILGGFKAFYTELEKMKRFGFSDDEVERAKTDILTNYENRVKKAETRKNPELVRPIIRSFFDKYPYMDPQTDYTLVSQILGQINSAALSQVAAQMITENNLVVIYTGPEKEGIATPTKEQLLAAIAEVKASDIKPNEATSIAKEFLNPSKLKGAKVKKSAASVCSSTEWTLKNGVKVTLLPTEYTKDQILFKLYRDGGLSRVETADLESFDRSVFSLYLSNTGVAGFSGTEVSKMLSGKTVYVRPFVSELENGVSGSTRGADLEIALQLAYLYYTAPRFDEDEFATGINQMKAILPNFMSQPNYKFQKEAMKTLYSDNPRRKITDEETVEKASAETLGRVYKQLFSDAAGLRMTVVGDFDINAIKPLIEKYIGSIPKGKAAPKWIDRKEYLAEGAIENVFDAKMQTPKSTVLNIYSAPVSYNAATMAALDAAEYILDIRYVNSLREDEGGTYGAHTSANVEKYPKEIASIETSFDCRPSACDKLRGLAKQGIKALAEEGPTAEETAAAILNLQKKIPENRLSNPYWRNNIEDFYEYGFDYDKEYEAAVAALDAAKIQAAVKSILDAGNLIEIVMTPSADSVEKE